MRRLAQTAFLSLALGLGSLYLVLPETFSASTLRSLARLGVSQLVLLTAVLVLRWLVGGWRTALLVRFSGASLTLWQGIRSHLVGTFASVVTPTEGGNAVGLTWLLTRYQVPLQNAVITSVLVTVLDMAFFSWSVPVAFLYLVHAGTTLPLAGLGWLVALFSVTVLALSLLLTFRLRLLIYAIRALFRAPGLRRYAERVRGFLFNLETASRTFAHAPWYAHLGLHACTALFWVVDFSLLLAVAAALRLGVAPLELLAIRTLIHAFAFAIPTPGASGYVEGALLFALAGRATPQAISTTVIVWRSLSYYLYFIVGPLIGGRALAKTAAGLFSKSGQSE